MKHLPSYLKVVEPFACVALLTIGISIAMNVEAASMESSSVPAASVPAGWLTDIQVFNLGTLGAGPWINVGYNGGIEKPGSFLDIYNFSVGPMTEVIANATASSLNFRASSVLNITGFKSEIIDSLNRTVWSSSDVPFSIGSTLPSGNYRFQVSGIADGSAGGAYLFSVAAVPEPDKWAMLLTGVLIAGYVGRRRKSK